LAASSSSSGNGDKGRNRGGMVGVGEKCAQRDGDGPSVYIPPLIGVVCLV
jgi:hypothetical protein